MDITRGSMDTIDLRTVAAYFNAQNPTYNLRGDNTTDVFGLITI